MDKDTSIRVLIAHRETQAYRERDKAKEKGGLDPQHHLKESQRTRARAKGVPNRPIASQSLNNLYLCRYLNTGQLVSIKRRVDL